MSRQNKLISLTVLVLFILACSTVTQPFSQAKDLAGTAQAVATAMPIQTLQSLATQISTQVPSGTLEALPSMVPSLEAFATNMPDIQGMINPQGTPVSEWKGIPVMSQATAGEENTDSTTYSYKADATVKEAQDFYGTELKNLGWTTFLNVPSDANGSIQIFQNDSSNLVVTIVEQSEGKILVILAMK
jgi:hypothetical protein